MVLVKKNQKVETDENIIFNWVDFGGIKQCPRTWSILAKKISWCRKQFTVSVSRFMVVE